MLLVSSVRHVASRPCSSSQRTLNAAASSLLTATCRARSPATGAQAGVDLPAGQETAHLDEITLTLPEGESRPADSNCVAAAG